MAITKGHGNPNWTREETILALDLYFDFGGRIPSGRNARIRELSEVLRTFPYHAAAARNESFRNPDGIAFKLQNLRQVATGKGLGNVSRTDREVWAEFGTNPELTKEAAQLIRTGIQIINEVREDPPIYEAFAEGRIVTETHLRRERDPKLRDRLIQERRKLSRLCCEICGREGVPGNAELTEAIFEAHHIFPLAKGERKTKISDMALLCACCHRLIHRVISIERKWLSIEDMKNYISECELA